ncbi:hypothetical protein BGZ57DRAFT_966016 [Hyaloscypha finlandica]|nr:hypothetical protein BGZ57DRAFT_966016 [Hyaloscypha finlandica]
MSKSKFEWIFFVKPVFWSVGLVSHCLNSIAPDNEASNFYINLPYLAASAAPVGKGPFCIPFLDLAFAPSAPPPPSSATAPPQTIPSTPSLPLPPTHKSSAKICGVAFVKAASVPITENVVLIQTAALDDCIGLCAAYNEANKTSIAGGADYVCNAVYWRNGFMNDDFPGTCFGFTTANSPGSGTGSFQTTEQSICDGAGWIDQMHLT